MPLFYCPDIMTMISAYATSMPGLKRFPKEVRLGIYEVTGFIQAPFISVGLVCSVAVALTNNFISKAQILIPQHRMTHRTKIQIGIWTANCWIVIFRLSLINTPGHTPITKMAPLDQQATWCFKNHSVSSLLGVVPAACVWIIPVQAW